MTDQFRVGLTHDFLKPDGTFAFGNIGLDLLESAPGIAWSVLEGDSTVLTAAQVKDFDALLVLAPRVAAATLEGVERLSVIARFGVGYDSVDVDACTRHDVAITITPDGVRRPVAVSVVTFLLALSQELFQKDRLTRAGRWAEKADAMGTGLIGRTLGLIGMGNIGREVFKLARPFDLRYIAYDPYASAEDARAAGAELVDLDTLLRMADFVAICCQLTPETRHLLNARRIGLMKPTAYLINTARGPVVDQRALTEALQQRRIRGAALDVFEEEPVDPNDPILKLDNVIVTPHAICWTDECFLGNGRSACEGILAIASGQIPRHVVNRAVLESPGFIQKLERYGARH